MAILSPGAISFAGLRKNFLIGAAAFALSAGAAQAQFFNNAPSNAREQNAEAADAASILRIDRLENQVRALNGQVEQLQFQNKKLEDQLRKFQMDVESRFQDSSGLAKPAPGARPSAAGTPQRRSDLSDDEAGNAPASVIADNGADSQARQALPPEPAITVPAAAPEAPVGADGRRHDAFDPAARPDAPGAPLALGSSGSASKPQPARVASTSGPLDLTPPNLRSAQQAEAGADSAEASPSLAALPAPGADPAAGPSSSSADPVKAEYDAAGDMLKTQHYDAAQRAFSAFVAKNPHSRLIAPAIYHLGESYYFQSRHREAAEQFLKIASDYAKSPVAPEAMVKLGVSLNALGAKEQACAFFSELPRKYPNAPASQKLAAEREAKKASC
jgi:tol-pal system protein YbgF